ncbi:MAG: HAD-IA family hydrolase [Candidatus Micrarchaeota archaeon]|nr:HAD-IA family hydrolase [Candidatus Micrarchaeota archaeon]
MEHEATKILIFDMEGVVVTSWHGFFRLIPDMKDLPQDKLEQIWEGVVADFNLNKLSEEEFINHIKKVSGTAASSKEIRAAIMSTVSEIAGMRYLISELKTKYKVALLTNYSKPWFEELNTRFGFRKLFDRVFISGYTGIRKPDRDAYTQVSEAFGVMPNECLFIDDREKLVVGAKSAGMDAIKFENVVQLSDYMKEKLGFKFGEPLHIFRSYDVRGIYNLDLNPETAMRIGRAIGTYLKRGSRITIAKDYRNGGSALHDAFIEGALSTGIDVVDIGTLPTPIFYHSIIHGEFDGGAMITASHNPPMWNGFKMCRKNADIISEEHGMEELRDIFANREFVEGNGEILQYKNAIDDYILHVTSKIKLKRKLRVVLDPGNGTWSGIAKRIFEKLGCEVIEINGTPDGNFSARGPDPNNFALTKLKEEVIKHSADFGAGFDADGDRAGFVNEKGEYVGTADMVLPLFALYLLGNKIKGAKVIYDIPCSTVIEETINALGGIPTLSRTGHSHIMTKMVEENAILGGEYSNHIYFPDNFNLDDGAYAAMKMAELISNQPEPLSVLMSKVANYPKVPITEIYCPDDLKFKVVEAAKQKLRTMGFGKIIDIDGVKAFDDSGWVLVRASNTMPQIKINSEGKTNEDAVRLFEMSRTIVMEEISKKML